MHWPLQLLSTLFLPAARRLQAALAKPQLAQQRVQKHICDRLVASEYGKFLGIQSLADWPRIPVVDYDDIEAWIQRQRQTQAPILTPERILFYEHTSGSRGPAKWIPYTRSLRRSFNHLFCVWAADLLRYGPAFNTGKVYFCISPRLNNPTAGIEVATGLTDDSEYLDDWLRWLLWPFLVAPPGIQCLPPDAFKQQLCLALLQEAQLETISIWSPSFLKVQLNYLQRHRLQLWEQLRNRISTKRVQLLLEPEIPWTQLWPDLKLISCWDSANAADSAQFLRSQFPGVMVQGKGLLATEAPMTVPLLQAGGYVPLLDEVFFEFEDDTQSIYSLEQLQQGQVYEIIISQKGGLYRYRMGDRVRVQSIYLETPCLEFLGRNQTISDLVGEKLHEEFVRHVLAGLPLAGASFQSLVPATNPEHYVLLLDRVQVAAEEIAVQLDQALFQSPHYRQARLLGQLAPAKVLVSEQIPETLITNQLRSGKKWGDLKHPVLATVAIKAELLTQLEQLTQLS